MPEGPGLGHGLAMSPSLDDRVADAPHRNWVDRYAGRRLRPYLRLSRLDRPIGTWLLLLPCWWSIALAAPRGHFPDLRLFVLFALGALLMRGAGCTFNDIADRDFDGRVERTRSRPLPSGEVGLGAAVFWLALQTLLGFAILMMLNRAAILLGIASLVLIVIYPFMKRVTWWPQFFLGLAFNWGALMGYAAVTGHLGWSPLILYAGGIAWTLGYDTIYAHQDKDDDALIGVKSTARLLGSCTLPWLAGFYAVALICIARVEIAAGGGRMLFLLLLVPAALHLAWQVRSLEIDHPANCLVRFRANRDFGLLVLAAIVVARLLA